MASHLELPSLCEGLCLRVDVGLRRLSILSAGRVGKMALAVTNGRSVAGPCFPLEDFPFDATAGISLMGLRF